MKLPTIIWRLRPIVTDVDLLRHDWRTAGDLPEVRKAGKLVRRYRKATVVQREAVRAAAEKNLNAQRESRRRVLTELNSKAQIFAAAQGVFTAIFGWGIVNRSTAQFRLEVGIACLGIGLLLSIISLCMLLWMVMAGNNSMWTRPLEDVGRRALRETRFERYLRNTNNGNNMEYVVEKRRRLLWQVGLVAILGNAVGFGWAVVLAVAYVFQ